MVKLGLIFCFLNTKKIQTTIYGPSQWTYWFTWISQNMFYKPGTKRSVHLIIYVIYLRKIKQNINYIYHWKVIQFIITWDVVWYNTYITSHHNYSRYSGGVVFMSQNSLCWDDSCQERIYHCQGHTRKSPSCCWKQAMWISIKIRNLACSWVKFVITRELPMYLL